MLINEKNFPISPNYLKQKKQAQLDLLHRQALEPVSDKKMSIGRNANKEEKLALAVPGFANARSSQISRLQSNHDVHNPPQNQNTHQRVRETMGSREASPTALKRK